MDQQRKWGSQYTDCQYTDHPAGAARRAARKALSVARVVRARRWRTRSFGSPPQM